MRVSLEWCSLCSELYGHDVTLASVRLLVLRLLFKLFCAVREGRRIPKGWGFGLKCLQVQQADTKNTRLRTQRREGFELLPV